MGIINTIFRTSKSNDYNTVLPVGNERLVSIMSYFHFKARELNSLYQIFSTIDKEGSGYIKLYDLYKLLNEEPCSMIAPYIEQLYSQIDKEIPDKISFLELIPVIGKFCLYSRDQIFDFVFMILDVNVDGFISKLDLIKFLTIERFGEQIFPFNFLVAIDDLDVDRTDRISLEQFLELEKDLMFLFYPAFRLQIGLQNAFCGIKFWENVYSNMFLGQNEETDLPLNEATVVKSLKRSDNIEKKIRQFDEFAKEGKFKMQATTSIKTLSQREPFRRGSTGKLCSKLPVFIEIEQKRHNSLIYRKNDFVIEKIEMRKVHDLTKINFKREKKPNNFRKMATISMKESSPNLINNNEDNFKSEMKKTSKSNQLQRTISNRLFKIKTLDVNKIPGNPSYDVPDNTPYGTSPKKASFVT